MNDVVWEVFVYEGPVAENGYGNLLCQLPGWTNMSISPLASAVGAGQVSIPLDSTIFWQDGYTPETTPVLQTETLWQVRMMVNGAYVMTNGIPAVFEFLAQSIDRTTVSSDETRTVTVSGPGAAQCLNWAMAMPFGWQPTDGGFIGVTGAIQDAFDEQTPDGEYEIDTALWNLSTPGACSIPDTTATYTQAVAPTGNIQTGAAWFDTSTSPVTEYLWDGSDWVDSDDYYSSTGGGSAQVNLTPAGAYLGGGAFNFVNSSFSASVSPAQPTTATAPGCPIDNDPCNGTDVTQIIIRPASGQGYMMIGLSYQLFYTQYVDKNGTLVSYKIGPGRVGGTGAYDSSWAQYWRLSCDLQSNGTYLLRWWVSGDGAAWTLSWSYVTPAAGQWDASQASVYMGGEYNTTGADGAYAQFSSLNGEIQTNADAGPIYISTPAMGMVYDQIANQAAPRGTIPFVNPTFTATQDSDGNTFADTWSVQIPIGTDMLTATQNYAGAVDAQFYMQPGYMLYCGLNPGRRLEDAVIWHEGEIQQYGRTQTRDQIYNVAASQDGGGMIWTEVSSASIAQWAQRETFVMSGGTIDAQSAANTAQAAVDQWDDEVDARILQIPVAMPGKTPFHDFTIFDWVGVERSDFSAADAMQVIGITVTVDQDGAETDEVVVNTYRQVLAQWFQYLMNKFGGQSASTLGALTPGDTAGSAFTLAVGPNLAVSPAQLGGSGSSSTGLSGQPGIAPAPEVVAGTSYQVQPVSVGAGNPSTGQPNATGTNAAGQTVALPGAVTVPGTLITPYTVPATALDFTLPGGSEVTFAASAPANPNVNDLWYDTSDGNAVFQWTGTTWQSYQFGIGAVNTSSLTATAIGGIQTFTQATAPTGTINPGSQWYDTASGNALYIYVSGSWTLYQTGAGGVAAGTALANIGAAGVTSTYLAAGVALSNIGSAGLTSSYLAAGTAIANIGSGTVSAALLAAGAALSNVGAAGITSSYIASNAIVAGAIAAGAVTAGTIASGAVVTASITAGDITSTLIATGAVVTAALASGSVTAVKISSGTITTTQISASAAIIGGQLAAGTITASNINSGTITTTQLSASAGILATQIAAGTITGTQIAASITLTSPAISGGSITGGSFIADGSSGEVLVYASAPAAGDLIGSWSATSGTDAQSNAYNAGLWVYDSAGNSMGLISGGASAASMLAMDTVGLGTPTPPAGCAALYGAGTGSVQIIDAADGQAYGTGRRSITLGSDATINSTSYGTVLSSPVAAPSWTARRYRFSGQFAVDPNQAAGQFGILVACAGLTAAASMLNVVWYEMTGGANSTVNARSNWTFGTGFNPAFTMATGYTYLAVVDGTVVLPAGTATNLEVQFAVSIAADTCGVQAGSYLDIMPV